MKKTMKTVRYEKPCISTVRLDARDVIRTSGLETMLFDGLYLGSDKHINYQSYKDLY